MNKKVLIAIISIIALTIVFLALILVNMPKAKLKASEEQRKNVEESEISTVDDTSSNTDSNLNKEKENVKQASDPYVIAWFSDTQGYHNYNRENILYSMTEYIADNYKKLDIQYVIHTGDIVDNYDSKRQWVTAKNSFGNFINEIPTLFVAGNHDVTSNHYYNLFKTHFGKKYYSTLDTFGGSHKNGVGRYDLLDINGEKVIITALGYHILDSDYEWLDSVLKEHSDRTAILCFHEYMNYDGEYSNHDGKKLQILVQQNSNVKMVLCGHSHGIDHFFAEYDDDGDGTNDRTVYQLLVDYQDAQDGGGGYITFLSFDADEYKVNVTSYSPYLNDYNYYDDTSKEEFSIPWEPVK